MSARLTSIRKYLEPVKAGSIKVIAFQYGKVASTAVVKGLKVHSGIAAAHAHTAEQAKAWFAGKETGIPFEQQGFALSEDGFAQISGLCQFIMTCLQFW